MLPMEKQNVGQENRRGIEELLLRWAGASSRRGHGWRTVDAGGDGHGSTGVRRLPMATGFGSVVASALGTSRAGNSDDGHDGSLCRGPATVRRASRMAHGAGTDVGRRRPVRHGAAAGAATASGSRQGAATGATGGGGRRVKEG